MTSTTVKEPGGAAGKTKNPGSPKSAKGARTAKATKAPPPSKADEIISALKAASHDKEIEFDRLVSALEEAIATAARKVYKVREMAARFDPKSGELTAWTPYRIVEKKTKPELEEGEGAPIDPDDVPLGMSVAAPVAAPIDPDKEIRLPWIEILPEEVPGLLAGELAGKSWIFVTDPDGAAVPLENPSDAVLGDEIRLWRSTDGLGRIAAQSAKQVLYQKVREAERDNVYNEYAPKVGQLITGTVKRFERGDMIVDLGRTEAVIPREHQSRAERYTQGERVRGVIVDVHRNPKGAQVVLSRTASELLIELMKLEVPEIFDNTVIVKGCVRRPGDRAKVAVVSRERDVDPVGACVGMRGARVQAIMRELRGERIDIIQFSDDLVTYAQNALSPAKITRVSVSPADPDEEIEIGADGEPIEPAPVLECIVEEDQLSLAIGKRGQNVQLAAALIGARIEIKSDAQVKEEVAQAFLRMQRRATPIAEIEGVDEEAAAAFAALGLSSVGDVLDAAQEDEEGGTPFEGLELSEELREAVIQSAREFEAAVEEEEESDFFDDEETAEGEESADGVEGTDDTEATDGAESPEGSEGEVESEVEGEEPAAETEAEPEAVAGESVKPTAEDRSK